MSTVVLCGRPGATAFEAARSALAALGPELSPPGGLEARLQAIAAGAEAPAVVVLACDGELIASTRRDAYVLWELGVPVVFTCDPADSLTDACVAFAAGVGHPEAPCLPAGEAAALRAAVGAAASAPVPATGVTPATEATPATAPHRVPATGATPATAPHRVPATGATPAAAPPPSGPQADQIRATIAWSGAEPLLRGRSYRLIAGGRDYTATVAPVKLRLDLETLEPVPATRLKAGEIGDCELELDRPLATARGRDGHPGTFVLADRVTGERTGLGLIRFGLRRAENLRWQPVTVDAAARARALAQVPCVVWLTGLSGAGKSTIADRVESALHARGRHTYLLDGDNVRHGLNRDLGFTDADRVENIRRVAEVARLMADAGLIVLVSFISPFRSERAMARERMGTVSFYEVFVDTPLAVAEARDPKGLYAKARRGELRNFTGIDSAYEPPEQPDLRLDTTRLTPDEAAQAILALIDAR
ncbi:MAG TPA: adenylyl-sulfate kinase [Solirubrobacteraceae bacterium]|nr:adenylyl-sulfate kinase [Solirubrobacteraceae bacterium]